MLQLLLRPSVFRHVVAAMLLLVWLLAMAAPFRGARRPLSRARVAPLVILAVLPYLSPRLGLAALAAVLLQVVSRLGSSWTAALVLALGGIGLMLVSARGASDWSFWIGAGTAAWGVVSAIARSQVRSSSLPFWTTNDPSLPLTHEDR